MKNFTTEQLAAEIIARAVTSRRFMTAYGAVVFGGMTALAGHSGTAVFAVGMTSAWFHGRLSGFPATRFGRRMSQAI